MNIKQSNKNEKITSEILVYYQNDKIIYIKILNYNLHNFLTIIDISLPNIHEDSYIIL